MIAQTLYDLRELTGFCSGADLHDLFRELTGEPSPSGFVEIDEQSLRETELGAKAIALLALPLGEMLAEIRVNLDPRPVCADTQERAPRW